MVSKTLTMDTESPHIEKLKALISESVMRPMESPKDFDCLYNTIRERTNETIGLNTLRRLWGYVEGYPTVRESTLDVLSRFVGYPDWHTFVADYCGVAGTESSCRIVSATLNTEDLAMGDAVAIEWNPNRRLELRHEGMGVFEVTKALNSKIVAGDHFHCERFMIGQPLYIDNLVHDDLPPSLFVVGKQGGLTKIERL